MSVWWVVCAWLAAQPAQAYSPDSPEVQRLVAKGLRYLEATGTQEYRLGGQAVVGLAILKSGHPASHPLIKRAVEACRKAVAETRKYTPTDYPAVDNYNLGLAIVFLCELDPETYRPEIEALLEKLLERQKAAGGWGYPESHPHWSTCDTSMTQYAALSAWSAVKTGVAQVSPKAIEQLCNWLLRTQDPSGGWGYQGNDPGIGRYQRVQQTDVSLSLTSAAMGSLYVCADLLGLVVERDQLPEGLPRVLERVETRPPAAESSERVPKGVLQQRLRDGNAWMNAHLAFEESYWTHYYMYALERYKSFQEWAEGREEKDPKWYNLGVEYLAKTQRDDGAWVTQGGFQVDTAFSVLFLLRSTQLSIRKVVELYSGTLRGGRGLPVRTEQVRVQNGNVVTQSLQTQADQLLEIIDQGITDGLLRVDRLVVELSPDPTQRETQRKRLREMVGAPRFSDRLAAVMALGQDRDLDNVPALIYGLSDPSPEVVRAARDGLKRVSRRVEGFGLPDDFTEEQRKEAIDQWQVWYESVRPAGAYPAGPAGEAAG